MLRLDLICFTKSGISAARITSVRPTIDSVHDSPPLGSRPSRSNSLCQPISTAEMM